MLLILGDGFEVIRFAPAKWPGVQIDSNSIIFRMELNEFTKQIRGSAEIFAEKTERPAGNFLKASGKKGCVLFRSLDAFEVKREFVLHHHRRV